MPRRELKNGKQVADWLAELGSSLNAPGNLTLIGSAALLWHAYDRGLTAELPDASMDVEIPEATVTSVKVPSPLL